jgi:2-polyprenyl-3-methyl-5-hydroxy-6-metoxy-1,4-benzoquinol methylase
MHWQQLHSDPNHPEVIQERRRLLKNAARPPVADRESYLEELVRGRRLLDVGIVDHEASQAVAKRSWLHRRLANAAASCLGVDVLKEEVERLQQQGFNVICRDITVEPLPEQFDVIVCGELIEHLGRPGDLFASARKMLAPGGRFVLTSPNPFQAFQFIREMIGRTNDSVDHVLFVFPSGVAEFASRAGLQLDAYRGTWLEGHRNLKHGLCRLLCQPFFHPEAYCPTMIYECIAPN